MIVAVDDLGHSKRGGIVPLQGGIRKLFVLDDRIVIASVGLMRHPGIEYKFEDWISAFIKTHYGALSDKHPMRVAAALEKQARETFHGIETLPDDELWNLNPPLKSLVSYVIAGYAQDCRVPYVIEFEAKLNVNGRHVEYAPALQYDTNPVVFGERKFAMRAQDGLEPERPYLQSIIPTLNIGAALPEIPPSLQDIVACVVGMVKVESKFNRDLVGENVRVGVLYRPTGTSFVAVF